MNFQSLADRKDIIRSYKIRIFLTCWILFTIHFATNVVREHYPAFTIAEQGTFKVDDYLGFHPDIFLHDDGHSYIGNNVAGSILAAVPLFIFDPLLDYLETVGKRQVSQLQERDDLDTTYRTKYKNRRNFFKLVKERGLHLRFGAATVITSAFLMAPLSAWLVVLMFQILLMRRVPLGRAVWYAMLFGFATPIFFRTAHLNHNMFVMVAVFVSFWLMWKRPEGSSLPSMKARLGAGFLAGCALLLDYVGVVPLLALFGYHFVTRLRDTGFKQTVIDTLPFVGAATIPVLYLLYTQWAMYGHPIWPGQYHMPEVKYTDRGWRGFSFPTLDLYYLNLFSASYGMYTFGPLLILALIPVRWYRQEDLIVPLWERRWVAIFFFLFLTFCAANQYSRQQFNSGFRYLLPMVPILFLTLSDHLKYLSNRWLIVLTIPVVLNSWVISMFRETVPESWRLFFSEGFQLPWLSVFRQTRPEIPAFLQGQLLPLLILFISGLMILAIWRFQRHKLSGVSNK